MKKLIILLLMVFGGQLIGQKQIVWFDIGAKAQWGATALYNKALWDSKIYDVNITTGYSVGGKFGINFGYNGVAIDLMYSNGNQEFGDKSNNTLGNINWKTTDVYVLYRNAKNLGYFEIGPKLSFLNSIDVTPTGGEAVDLIDFNEKSNIAGVIGFGANIMGTDGRFSGILGLRFEYGLKNMNNTDAIAVGSPVYDQGLLYADGEENTNPVFAGVVFELNWGVGYFGKAQCGGRSKFIMF
jgi:hypothetical protein